MKLIGAWILRAPSSSFKDYQTFACLFSFILSPTPGCFFFFFPLLDYFTANLENFHYLKAVWNNLIWKYNALGLRRLGGDLRAGFFPYPLVGRIWGSLLQAPPPTTPPNHSHTNSSLQEALASSHLPTGLQLHRGSRSLQPQDWAPHFPITDTERLRVWGRENWQSDLHKTTQGPKTGSSVRHYFHYEWKYELPPTSFSCFTSNHKRSASFKTHLHSNLISG